MAVREGAASVACCLITGLGTVVSLAAQAEGWTITPSVTLSETYTDNVNLAPADQAESDFITEIRPGLKIARTGEGGRFKLSVDYQLSGFLRQAKESAGSSTQNSLRALGNLEAIENWLFVDANAQISQQSVSAFGPFAPSNANVTANRTEARTFTVSPYVRSTFGSLASYEVRYGETTFRTKDNLGADSLTRQWTGHLTSLPGRGPAGWAIDYTDQQIDFKNQADQRSTLLRGLLSYQIDPEVTVHGFVGRESNNFSFGSEQSFAIRGAGVDWAPTERTRVSAEQEKRFFGTGHTYSIHHRTPLTAWSLVDSKDITTTANQLSNAGAGTIFDLLFSNLASAIPDPVQRTEAVQRLLVQAGIPPALISPSSFITPRVFLQRRQEGSFALLGARNTVTFTAFHNDSESVTGALTASGATDDLAAVTVLRQRGLSADWSHKLSGLSSLSLLATWIRSTGSSTSVSDSSPRTTYRLLSLQYSTSFSPKTTGSLLLRHARSDDEQNGASSFRENALVGTLTHQF